MIKRGSSRPRKAVNAKIADQFQSIFGVIAAIDERIHNLSQQKSQIETETTKLKSDLATLEQKQHRSASDLAAGKYTAADVVAIGRQLNGIQSDLTSHESALSALAVALESLATEKSGKIC